MNEEEEEKGHAKSLHPNNLVMQKSTVPVGTVTWEFHCPDTGVHCPEDSGTAIVLNPALGSARIVGQGCDVVSLNLCGSTEEKTNVVILRKSVCKPGSGACRRIVSFSKVMA